MRSFKTKIISISTLVSILILSFCLHADAEVTKYKGMLTDRWSIPASNNAFDEALCETNLHIAIEGGGTNTRIRINDIATEMNEAPKELYAYKVQEGSNIYQSTESAAHIVRKLINNGIQSIASQHSWDTEKVCYELGLGMAGTEGKDNALFLKALQNDPRMKRAILVSDAEAAWLSAFDTEGTIIIAGTGSIILSRNAAGKKFRKGGYGIPMSDQRSAAALCLYYGECINEEVGLEDGKAVWREDIKLAFFEKLLSENKGSDEELFMKLTSMARFNVSEFAAMAPHIIEYAALEMINEHSWKRTACSTSNGTCKTNPISDCLDNKDFCATEAVITSSRKLYNAILSLPADFQGLPFAIHGSYGNVLWDKMTELFGKEGYIANLKINTPIDPLAGIQKLLE